MIRQISQKYNPLTKKLRSLLTLLMLSFVSVAYPSAIDTIDILVKLDVQGTAHIAEYWKVSVDDSNTEWYISLKNMHNMPISDFRVFDYETGEYFKDDTPWVVERTRSEKRGLSGVKKPSADSYELCWGVGSSGPHSWSAEYKIEGFVKQYKDGAGFNHCFVNYGLSAAPHFVRTTIVMADSTPITYDNARIWAFQYTGVCLFEGGAVVAQSSESLSPSQSMVVMCIFPQGIFQSPNVVDDTIGTMKWEALEGSDYLEHYTEEDYAQGKNVLSANEKTTMSWSEVLEVLKYFIMFVVIMLLGFGGLFFVLTFGITVVYYVLSYLWYIVRLRPLIIYFRRKKVLGEEEHPYFRGLPIKGNLNRTFYLFDTYNYRVWTLEKDNLYAAYLVRLMRLKALTMITTEENGELVNRLKVAENMTFNEENKADAKAMEFFYKIIKEASGENLILEKGELEKYKIAHEEVNKQLEVIMKTEDTSEATPKEFQEVTGLENFLKDFTLLDRRGAVEVELWDEYLVYATLYGIADQVMKNFKESCPEYFQLSYLGNQLIDKRGSVISDFNAFTGVSNLSSSLSSSWGRSSGGGGRSSGGGGGGHSGGGGGGGGR